MFEGKIQGLYVAEGAGTPMRAVSEANALPGVGLQGDRYAARIGSFSDRHDASREITLIESEALEAIAREDGIELPDGASRRNIVTEGVPLNHLVGREFFVGDVRLRGIRLCEPCDTLVKHTGQPVVRPLLHRGGLRAAIVSGGTLRVGDLVREA